MLQALLHAAINVSDLAVAEQFYGGVLGLTKVERVLSFPGAWYQLGPLQLHLIEAKGNYRPPSPDEKWGRRAHLAFAIEDLTTTQQQLSQADIPIQPSSSGRAAIFIQDPDGHIIELSQL
ncbi:MAG: VOC family protein [Cyanobacteria bacterium P01_D01_bin.156]